MGEMKLENQTSVFSWALDFPFSWCFCYVIFIIVLWDGSCLLWKVNPIFVKMAEFHVIGRHRKGWVLNNSSSFESARMKSGVIFMSWPTENCSPNWTSRERRFGLDCVEISGSGPQAIRLRLELKNHMVSFFPLHELKLKNHMISFFPLHELNIRQNATDINFIAPGGIVRFTYMIKLENLGYG